ncbi:MAG TPA: TIGR01244 family sulfur transferase [Paucimonas sp.]|nr:TIGR01244 family sulfur transferase [Paucimonas sp.]
MSVTITPVAEGFSVAPQLTPADMAELARLGFRSVINNRPDGEGGPDQPSGEQMRAAAEAAGLAYAHVPSAPSADDPAVIERTRVVLRELPQPVLAFCRSGARSTKLFRAATGG